jgi:hypothetical protein
MKRRPRASASSPRYVRIRFMEGRPLPRKKDVVLTLLEGPSVFLHLDPRRDGVVVPKWLAKQPQLVLQVGLNMSVPIPDLRVDDEGVTCTLSFNRAPFWCKLPWPAIYAAIGEDRRGMVWPDDVPSEVATQMQKKPAGPGGATAAGQPHERGRPARGGGRGQADLALEATAPRGSRRGAKIGALPTPRRAASEPSSPSRARPSPRSPWCQRPSASAPRRPSPRETRPRPPSPPRRARAPVEASPAPSPAPSAEAAPSPASSPASSAEGDGSEVVEPAPAAGKKKRELPPYLRVIK